MSPFAKLLREFRSKTSITQQELATRVCLERSYVAALECGTRPPPSHQVVVKFCLALGLSSAQASRLHAARQKSSRSYLLHSDAPEGAYELAHRLFSIVHELSEDDLQLLNGLLVKFVHTSRLPSGAKAGLSGVEIFQPEETPM